MPETANKATRALGTKLLKGETPIGGLTSIGGIEITADEIDASTLDSEGGYGEYIGGRKDAGEVPIEGFFNPDTASGQVALQTSFESGLAEDYKIQFPTTPKSEWAFKGVVTGFKVGDVDVDGTVQFGATIRVSGKPTLTIGTGGGGDD